MTAQTDDRFAVDHAHGRDALVASVRDRSWVMRIGDRWTTAQHGATYPVDCPATGEHLADAPDASADDIDSAVRAAKQAWPGWAGRDPRSRAGVLRAVAAVLRDNIDELAVLESLDSGHPVTAMRGDVALAADMLETYADWSSLLKGETIPASGSHLNFTVREPYGVVARIVAYNHPLMFLATRMAAPLLAGNVVVMKAPDQCPLSGLRLAELIAEVVPPGVVTVVTGRGAVSGNALVRHDDVRRIAFIGSVATGRRIQETAAQCGVKNITLELGGKNAMIVFPDVDPDEAARAAINGMNFRWTAGQSCGSTSRLLVHHSMYEDIVGRVAALVEEIRLGDPLDEKSEMGCLVSSSHQQGIARQVAGAIERGARLVTAPLPEGPPFDRGHWMAPTVLADVTPEMDIAGHELFGPVLVVMRYDTEAEAVAIANDPPYGLTASIYTNDIRRAHRVSRLLDAGYIWINDASRHFPGVPFGGVKDSGVGREESIEELHSFTQIKTINVALS
ncbi:aldehyde dehydrogenase family protein [uncultured Arthrobacter sp.]|uniref:aldehyde dehydrogenase family protein n=1 Tax=uncultured Arthrobacter sp. TaxID=114050 RepID=UPI0025EA5111|nr:aldehyde dehydrogenase family protein [uncultured Arthrobacter sp.]